MAEQIGSNAPIIDEEKVKEKINAALENPNVNVHKFSPDDSPEKKAEQVAAQRPKVELGTATTAAAISDIDKAKALETINSLPGGMGLSSKTDIPMWARIGWERVANPETEVGPATPESDYFDEVLGELYFGKLWLNAGVVFVAVFVTWLVTVLGFGFGWVLLICAFVATYFKHSVNRFYRNARSDISRELAKERLETEEESTEWLNEFMRRFWLIYEPVLAASIVQSVDAVLVASTPSFLDSLRLSTFTLGTKPPHIESIKSYPKTEDDIVMMDWKLAFEPNDLANMTKQQLRNKVNPKIVLTVRVGRGMVGAGIPILLEDISFSGKLRIKLKLMNNFPHIQTVWLSFLEPPKIDFILKPIGGETFGFDIANFPGLSTFIHDQVHGSLKPMMYAPNEYELDMETMMSGVPLDAAIGVVKLTIYNAKGLKNIETFGTSDPYVKLSLNGYTEVARTKVIADSLNPHWNETHYITLTNLQDTLNFELFDKNVGKDKLLGSAVFACNVLKEDPRQEQIITEVITNGKPHGTLRFDAIWYPVAPRGPDDPIIESNIGILRYTIHQAKDLDAKHSVVGQYNPYAELRCNGKVVHTTKTLKRTNNPVWEESKEIFITDKSTVTVGVAIKDSRDFTEDPIVASWTNTIPAFMQALERSDWFNFYKSSSKLRVSCVWKPVLLDYTPSATGYEEPIGVIKLNIKSAKNLKNVEKFGKSDPYARIRSGPMIRGRTETIEDNLNPVWNYIHYVPIHNLKESISIEVMDYQNAGKDRTLGHTEVLVQSLARRKEDGTHEAITSLDITAPLSIGRETRGELSYSATFYPSLRVAKESEAEKKVTEAKTDHDAAAITEVKKPEGIVNVMEHPSGILVIDINKVTIERKNIFVELYIDAVLFPFYRTSKSKQSNPTFNEVADVFIKELDWSVLRFNIRHEEKDDPIGTASINVQDLIRNSKDGVIIPIDDLREASINVKAHYIPTPVKLLPFESINNMGVLTVTLKCAENLRGADRSGTSDPYIQFLYNGEKVFRSKTVKKNCNPTFDEKFDLRVLSRKDAKFTFEVYDWNAVTSHEKLGCGTIDINVLEPFEGLDKIYPLDGEDNGSIRVILLFRPEFIALKRHSTSTFRALTGLVTPSVTGVGDNLAKGGKGMVTVVGSGADLVETPYVIDPQPLSRSASEVKQEKENGHNNQRKSSLDHIHASADANGGGESGILTVAIVEAKDLKAADKSTSDPFVRVFNNKKELYKTQTVKKNCSPKWGETFTIPTSVNESTQLKFSIKDYNRVGNNVDLGDVDLRVWDHINNSSNKVDLWENVNGGGKLHIQLEFTPGNDRHSSDGSSGGSSKGRKLKLPFRNKA
ncbi:5831_t:CDS:10 [Ambispora gerdemannii]|uniref:5831_t:CDS:1 n=1 Tax=Ambispora gerdemannii TaxID=144530 RepID=A0A9N8VRY9_9GLOM|nr:5831_t:CDS:10 [Ambispora gerdemannii]